MYSKLLIFVSAIAFASASCPDSCSGHGSCGSYDSCTCFARWSGVNCAQRECPYGLSWVAANPDVTTLKIPAGGNLGGKHAYTECSSRGVCNRDSGECECFPGYEGRGCRRSTCPNDCSGHGRCLYNYQINSAVNTYVDFNNQDWDQKKSRQCVCDAGYSGVDCSERMCPKGDDPITTCGVNDANAPTDAGISHHTVQKLTFDANCDQGKFFALTYKDSYGGEWITRPISPACVTSGTDLSDTGASATEIAAATATCSAIESALEELPNFIIPNVTSAFSAVGTDGSFACDIGFTDAANSGLQAKLEIESYNHNNANMQPRYDLGDLDTQITITIDVTHHQTGGSYTENHECSNRGLCDHSTGLCSCFSGYTGESCHEQTIYF